MEFASIEREIHIDAAPEVVYGVISMPEHLREWWPDKAEIEPTAGATGVISFGDRSAPDVKIVALTVVAADPFRRFSFRWVYDDGETATPANSLLVTFDLIPSGVGTLLRFTETGFREKGWESAVLEKQYREHASGWDYFLPRLLTYVARLVSTP
ncbi:polyketide cyclase [Arthrobacter sp. KBS0702]|uniref:SRPBCC domain-containing protein n=1 Tax=Arthrobacter sp. KBS0702 TaxID=2578107 RepID=UPI00110E2AC0|nr:SRPBCC domain-containing protein [Arthrobacter sp. KBS0702]QDW29596.1 polyketide cyclase [Arthrobacter sp. KBS0702]